MAEQSPEVSTESEQSEWIADARKNISGFLDLRDLTERFHQLKEYLTNARCVVIVAEENFYDLDKDIDKLFHETCKVALQSRDLMGLFESKCKQALSDIKLIRVHLQDGSIDRAVSKLRSLQEMSLMMKTESAKMEVKFELLTEEVRKVIVGTYDKKSVVRGKKNYHLDKIDHSIKISKAKIKTAIDEVHRAQKEKDFHENKLEASEASNLKSLFNHLNLVAISIESFLTIKSEIRTPDLKLQRETMNAKAAALAKAEEEKDISVENKEYFEIEKRNVQEKNSNLGTVLNWLEKSILLMHKLEVSMLKMTSFWWQIKECCFSVLRATEHELINAKSELETYSLSPGVVLSLNQFTELWVALKEVCKMSKEELRKVTDDLFRAYEENISPVEADKHLQATLQTNWESDVD